MGKIGTWGTRTAGTQGTTGHQDCGDMGHYGSPSSGDMGHNRAWGPRDKDSGNLGHHRAPGNGDMWHLGPPAPRGHGPAAPQDTGTWRTRGRTKARPCHRRDVARGQRWPRDGDPTGQQGPVGAGGSGGLAQVLEVAQVLEDEDQGGPAKDDAAEGPTLQQPREEGPQALGRPRATPRHGTGLGRPRCACGVTNTRASHPARHSHGDTPLYPPSTQSGGLRGTWLHVATRAKATVVPALPLVPVCRRLAPIPCACQGTGKDPACSWGVAHPCTRARVFTRMRTCAHACTRVHMCWHPSCAPAHPHPPARGQALLLSLSPSLPLQRSLDPGKGCLGQAVHTRTMHTRTPPPARPPPH